MSRVDSVSLDDLVSSHPSEESIGEYEFDEVMSISCEDQLCAESLILDTKSWIIWEALHGCHEGVYGDIPNKYNDALAIFEVEGQPGVSSMDDADDSDDFLMKIAGATETSEQPWSLPAPLFRISPEDALLQSNVRVLEVSHMTPAAAVYFTPDLSNLSPNASLPSLSIFRDIASPLLLPTKAIFASAVCTSSSQFPATASKESFHILRRHNRLATTSALRQAHALNMDLPIIGILFRGREVAIHTDWYEAKDGMLYFYSAFYSSDPNDIEPKVWNLDNVTDTQHILCIFSNLRKYTHTRFAQCIQQGLSSLSQYNIEPWKWDASVLPSTLIMSRVREHADSEEPHEEKMERWQKSLHMPEIETKLIHVKRMLLEHMLSPPTPEDSF